MNLSSVSVVKNILDKNELRAEKRFGQNFLTDANVLNKIIAAADIGCGDNIIEIGPGLGVLTTELAKRSQSVIAIEIDKKLISVLEKNLKDFSNVEIINEDFLKLDLKKLVSDKFGSDKPVKIVANLPYYITTPIICSALESGANISGIIVMVQKEVAERFSAKPSTKAYGALTLMLEYYADVTVVSNVSPGCFYPQPNVVSSVVRFDLLKSPRVEVSDSGLMFRIIKAAFAMRRKTLVNCLYDEFLDSTGKLLLKEKITRVLKQTDLPENIRGEALGLSQFARLTDNFALFYPLR